MARARRLPDPRRDAVGARRVELRGARHEARPHARSRPTSCSSASTPSSSARCRGSRRSRCTCCSARGACSRSGREEFGAYYRRVRARLEAFVADPPRDRAVPVRPLRHLRLQARLRRRTGTRSTTSRRVAGHPPRADREARRRRDRRRSPRSARRRRSRRRRDLARDLDEDPRAGRAAALGARDTARDSLPSCSQPQPGSRVRAAARALAGRPLLRLRGQPVLGTRTAASSTSGGSSTSTRNFTPLHAYDHDERAARVRDSSSTSSTSGSRGSPTCTSTTTRTTRSPRSKRLMGRYGTREDELDDLLRRGVFVDLLARRPQRHPHLAARLRPEGARGVPRLSSGAPRSRTAARRSSSSSEWMQTRDQALLDADRRLQRGGLHRDAARCATGCSNCKRRGDRAVRAASAAPEPDEPKPITGGRAERAALRDALLDAGHELAAHLLEYHRRERKPVWWAFFDRLEQTPDELARGRRLDRRARGSSASRSR